MFLLLSLACAPTEPDDALETGQDTDVLEEPDADTDLVMSSWSIEKKVSMQLQYFTNCMTGVGSR